MHTLDTAPPALGGVLEDALKLYRRSFTRCWPIALLGASLSAAAGWYPMQRMNAIGHGDATLADAVAAVAQLQALGHSFGVWLAAIAAALIWLMVRAAVFAQQNAVATGHTDLLGAALAVALRRLPSMLLAAAIWITALVIGTLLLVVPGIWLGGQLQLWMVAMFADGLGPLQSLQRSWQRVEGRWWRTSSLVTVAVLIDMLPSLADGIGGWIASAFFKADPATASIVTQLAAVLLSVVTIPMATAVMLSIYRQLAVRSRESASPGNSQRALWSRDGA